MAAIRDETPGRDARQTRRVALLNQKGGVGKTTTTVNLAAAIAEQGRPTLIVDIDPQSHATLHLGVDPDGLDRSIYDLLLDPELPATEALIESRPNLGLLPAEVHLAAAETELVGEADRQDRLHRILDRLSDQYEFVFIDCPPSLGILTLNALAASGEVLVPLQAHFFALQGVSKLLETVQLVSQAANPDLVVAGVILCMHEERATLSKEVVADLDEFFHASREGGAPWSDAKVFRPPVRRNIKLAECPSFGQTIFEYSKWCPGALDYRALAKSFIEEWDARKSVKAEEIAQAPEDPRDALEEPTEDTTAEIVVRPSAAAEMTG